MISFLWFNIINITREMAFVSEASGSDIRTEWDFIDVTAFTETPRGARGARGVGLQ